MLYCCEQENSIFDRMKIQKGVRKKKIDDGSAKLRYGKPYVLFQWFYNIPFLQNSPIGEQNCLKYISFKQLL